MSEYSLSCTHVWVIESPQPDHDELYAFCRRCDAERLFPKDHEEARFNPRTHRPADSLRTKAIKGGQATARAQRKQ